MQLSACRLAGLTALAVLLPGAAPPREGSLEDALQSIKPDAILQHIKVLASDEYEGRGPGTPGEDKTIAYLTGQFRAMGLKPGNPDGSYVQNVPLVGFQATRVAGSFRAGGKTIELDFPRTSWPCRAGPVNSRRSTTRRSSSSVTAWSRREYGWDDFKGLDVRGKTLIMLVGDPPVPDPHDSSKLDPAMFKGRAMTYYGRWTYKYEIAAKLGASAAIIVHEDGPAGYPFSVVQGSWSRENFDIVSSGSVAPAPAVPVKGWIDSPTAKALCLAAGQDLAALKSAAVRRDFRPVVLNARARFDIEVKARQVQSHNVIARLEGSDPALKNQYVVYTAHWDHLGIDPNLKGDQIYNGAADNASGVAAVLEIARAFTHIRPIPKRSLLFLFVTAEEKGLLGSKYYASAPLYPLEQTLADINLDVINLWGQTSDLISIGMGQSTLDDLLVEVARARGAPLGPTPSPKRGTTIDPTISSSPSKVSPRSTPKAVGNTSTNPPITRSKSRMSTPRRTITRSATR